MLRFTKIITTIGPATCSPEILSQLIQAGADVLRFNLKHNTAEWHQHTIDTAKSIAQELGKNVAILIDVPKIELASTVTGHDFVALSYITSAEEVEFFRQTQTGENPPKIIAKIENKSALINLDSIVKVSDGIMIARGDLGEDIPFEHLAFWQKKIITACRLAQTPVIVATQMLQSMTHNPHPTRAEATDVANAVFDGTDCVMLSEETAIGEYPVEAVIQMDKIASFCDLQLDIKPILFPAPTPSDLLIKSAASMIQSSSGAIKAAVVFSQSGSTVRKLSAYRLLVPIIAITNNREVLEMINLSRGTLPHYSSIDSPSFQIESPLFQELLSYSFLKAGDTVLVIHGSNWFSSGSTSDISLKIL